MIYIVNKRYYNQLKDFFKSIDYKIEENSKKSMEQDLIWIPYSNQPKGNILHQSEVVHPSSKTPLTATLHEKLILFGNMCLEYNFDLKFGIKDGAIKFQIENSSMTFQLVKGDHQLWKAVLRLYLNQKGFHETFKPIKKIGKGNFASVYLVQKIENKCKYAVKAFSKQAAYSEQNGKQCLIKEIEIMRQFSHHSLMKLEEVFQSDNSLYIVFQLLEGGQLYDKIKQKYQFKPCQIQTMMKDLLEGLKQMHSKGIMHRDLKPENILLRSKNGVECVIADFGLAQFAEAQEYLFVRCGTPGYVAPQVINIKDMKQKYSPICDIFSLGLIFHVFLFGFSIFRKKTYQEVLAQNRSCNFTFDDEVYETVSSEALDLLKKMLRVNPEERINAEQSLAHPYFKTEQMQEPRLGIKSKISMASTVESESPKPVNEKIQYQKDSCLELKQGHKNIYTGLGTLPQANTKVSVCMFGQALTPGRVSKITKFARQT